MSVLAVEDLTIAYGDTAVVSGLTFAVDAAEAVGLVGESGSGKTQAALAMLGLSPDNAAVEGSIRVDGIEVVGARPAELDRIRAERVAMIFQDPMRALNPYRRIGRQLGQILARHGIARGKDADARVVEMLGKVGLPDPERQARAFPHELSGGMRQRVMIASALITAPALLIADEPTTSLDVTVQAQILDLLETLRDETALLLITHDLGVVAGACERLLVIDDGRLVEAGPTRSLFAAPSSARLEQLLAVAPRIDSGEIRRPVEVRPVFEVRDAHVRYRERRIARAVHAVRGAGFEVSRGETLAIVGESGSGKSSLVRAALGLVPLAAGTVVYSGEPLPESLSGRSLDTKRELQLVFQDPLSSLDPQHSVGAIVAEPLGLHRPDLVRRERGAAVVAMLERVGLGEQFMSRYPHELSGGQAQRVAIARALVIGPDVLVCDEAVAALDGRVRQQVLELLADIQRDAGLAIVFIAHDLAVVRRIAHRVLVMYLGVAAEVADAATLFERPTHPYTRALIDAVPSPDPLARPSGPPLAGEVPSILSPPPGCAFEPRCPHAHERCAREVPLLREIGAARVACHRADELDLSVAER